MPVVVLSRSDVSTPWGFRLHGGKDFGSPLTVQRINPGSLASKCGLLIGDVILKIDSTVATDLKHKDAQDLIVKCDKNIELTISRGQETVKQSPSKTADFTSSTDLQSPTVLSPSYAPKPFSGPSSYGQKVEKLTNDTASLDISKKYEYNDPAKWDPPPVRGVAVPPASGYNPGTETKKYVPSETCKLVNDMEAGHETPYNPRTGAERRPAPVQSKLMDILEKRCGETSSNSKSPSGSWQGPPSGTGFRSTPPQGAQSTAPGVPSTSRGYHAAAAAPGGTAPSKPGGFKSASSFGTDRRPSRDGKKTHLEEALSMPAFSGPNVPVCNVDGMPVKGPYVTAVKKIWCQEHFVCSNPSCNQSLADTGFVEEDGQLFCKRDYEQYFAPRCAKCDQPIVGDTVKALQKTYHPSCFSCRHCKQPIMGGLFHLEQGEPYCEKDWAAMFQSKCFGCNFPIEMGDTWIEALGQNWHAECFNCTTCHTNLESQGFVTRGGRPYCKDHARA